MFYRGERVEVARPISVPQLQGEQGTVEGMTGDKVLVNLDCTDIRPIPYRPYELDKCRSRYEQAQATYPE